MKLAASSHALAASKIGLFTGAVIAATIFATSSGATTFMTQKQLLATFAGYSVRGIFTADEQSINNYTDAIYNKALAYMLKNPPRVYGHGAEVDAENKRLAKENRHLYENMGRFELVMNYLAAKCSEMHPAHDANCDGRAMLLLHQIQQQQRALTGF